MVLRLLGGALKGARLSSPEGTGLRPTSVRRRAAMLDIVRARVPSLHGLRAGDVFAGTGAVGFELLSAGATHVTFVESDPAAAALIRRNARALGLDAQIAVVSADATRLGAPPTPLDVLFLDPPYGQGLAEPALERLMAGGWLAADALVLVELGRADRFVPPPGLSIAREHPHGAGRLVRLAATASRSAGDRGEGEA